MPPIDHQQQGSWGGDFLRLGFQTHSNTQDILMQKITHPNSGAENKEQAYACTNIKRKDAEYGNPI